MRTAETRTLLLLFRHKNKASKGTCMSVHYRWFNPLSDCMLGEIWSGKHIINHRVSTFLYAMGKALCSQSPPPPPYVTTAPTPYRASSHSSSSYDSCVSHCYLRSSFWAKYNCCIEWGIYFVLYFSCIPCRYEKCGNYCMCSLHCTYY